MLIQEAFMDAQRFPSSQYLEDEFIEKLSNGTKRSRLECMKIAEVFLQSPYSHSSPDWNKIKEHIKHGSSSDNDIDDEYIDVDFKQVVTPEVNQVISEINNWFYGQCRFVMYQWRIFGLNYFCFIMDTHIIQILVTINAIRIQRKKEKCA